MESDRTLLFCLVLFVVGFCSFVDCSPNGAPQAACSTMKPSHGVGWQNSTSPFEIVVDKTSIPWHESLKIQLKVRDSVDSSEPYFEGFKGFMIMVFDATGNNIEPLGFFDEDATDTDKKTMDCPSETSDSNPNVGMTHTNNNFKKSVEAIWNPPEHYIGPIIVVATFVHQKEMFWTKENSHHVDVLPAEGTTTAPTSPTTTMLSTTTTAKPATTAAPAAASLKAIIEWPILVLAISSVLVIRTKSY